MTRFAALILALAFALTAPPALAQPSADEAAFRAIYEELVEIDTSPSTGSCTRAAEAMAVRLRAAGYSEDDVRVIIPEGRPDDGNVTAVLRGTSRRAVLLLAHIDVVDARREDWTRDPFTLVEENGFFYGRGTADDKSMAAVFVDLMIRFRAEGLRPRRSIKLALTCGEETSNRINGVDYLLNHHRDLIEADFALNEGGGGTLSEAGAPIAVNVQVGEKIHQVMQFEVINPGGHSSTPRADNAIYRLSAALQRLEAFAFPIALNPVTRAYLEEMAPLTGGALGAAMTALARNPNDAEAAAVLSRDPLYNATLRTLCTATQLDAGHAPNALPQRARATLSCRILPGQTPVQVRDELQRVVADAGVSVTIVRERTGSPQPALTREVLAPIERATARLFPNTPVIPFMSVGATDGRFLNAAGIETYGVSGMLAVPGEMFAHGLNEKIRVQSLMDGRAFLEAIVRDYAR